MRVRWTIVLAAVAGAFAAGEAAAGARPPAKAVPADFYSGRWYEIARTPNAGQRDCEAPTTEFQRPVQRRDIELVSDTGAFAVVQTCRKGQPTGPARVFSTRGQIIAGSRNTRFWMSFLGGLKKQEYWVLDRADDQSWAIMGTPGGHYVWLLSRRPVMAAADRAAALLRVRALGYETLDFPTPAP